jgi:hypothetical protein
MNLLWLMASAVAQPGISGWAVDAQVITWAGGEIIQERGSVAGIPLVGPPRVRTRDLQGRPWRTLQPWPDLGGVSLDPIVSMEVAAEEVASGWGVFPRRRGTLALFPDGRQAHLAWEFGIHAAGSDWSVWVDAADGTVFHAEAASWSATGAIYDPNPVDADLEYVELLGLSDPLQMSGQFAFATTCTEWEIDLKPFGKRVCLSWAHASKATLLGDHIHTPEEGASEDPFTEVQVYHHVDKISRWAATEFGLSLGRPIQIFTNFPLTNAFFGDFNDDGTRDLSFGISDDGFNLGYDSDVVYHEFGHALVRRLAGGMWMKADTLGVDWTPGALNEGVADTFAMIMNPDPLLAESMARSERWDRAIRDLSYARICPDDLQSQVHRSGTIWASTTWAMIDDTRIGPDLMAQLLVAAVSGWSNSTDWPDAGRSIIDAAEQLLVQGVIEAETAAAIELHIEGSGMLDCERIVDLEAVPAMKLSLINYGLSGDYERVAAGVQFRHWVPPEADHLRLKVSDFSGVEDGTGLAVTIRLGSPVAHDTMRVEGLGLHHAVVVDFDAVFEVDTEDAELIIDADTVAGFEPGMEVFGSVASINRSRVPMDVAYASVVLSADAVLKTGSQSIDVEGGGCANVSMRHGERYRYLVLSCLLAVALIGRRSSIEA